MERSDITTTDYKPSDWTLVRRIVILLCLLLSLITADRRYTMNVITPVHFEGTP